MFDIWTPVNMPTSWYLELRVRGNVASKALATKAYTQRKVEDEMSGYPAVVRLLVVKAKRRQGNARVKADEKPRGSLGSVISGL